MAKSKKDLDKIIDEKIKKAEKEGRITYGPNDKELPEDEFSDENCKIRITTYVDKIVLNALKKEAKEKGIKYQALLNQKLRDILFEEKPTLDDVMKKLNKLEKQFKKKAS